MVKLMEEGNNALTKIKTIGDIFRLPGGARESSKSTAASHSNQVSALGHIEEYFG